VPERLAVRKAYRTTCWTVRTVAHSGWAKCRVSGDKTGGMEAYRSCCAWHGFIPNFTNKKLTLLRVGQNPFRISIRNPAVLIEDFRDFPHLLQTDSQVVSQTRPQLLPSSGVPRGVWGFKPPSPRNSEGPPKSCQTQPDCEHC